MAERRIEFTRGRVKSVTFDMNFALNEELLSHEDGLSVNLIVSLHGLETSSGQPPQVIWAPPQVICRF